MSKLIPHVTGLRLNLVGALAVGLALGGCSWFSKDEPKAANPRVDATDPKAPYPKLASVPDKRPDTTTPAQRLQIQEGLMADRDNARHVDGPVAGQDNRPIATTDPKADIKPTVFMPPTAAEVAQRQAMAERNAAIQAQQAANRPPPRQLELSVGRDGFVTGIAFAPDATTLPPGSGRTIVNIAELHRAVGGKIRIVGHSVTAALDADPAQDRAKKMAQAEARARAVAGGLISLGVKADDIRLVSMGDSQPVGPKGDASKDAQNSRVTVFIEGAKR